jgi:hypothetical protein
MSSQYSPRVRNAHLGANPSGLPVLFYAGVGFYLFSFFLLAVQLAGTPLPGWTCAWYSLDAWRIPEASRLAIFGGLLNPLAALYILLRLQRRSARLRACISVAIVIFILLTWIASSRMQLGILVGHVVWVAGLTLILLPGSQAWPSLTDLRWPGVAALILIGWLGYARFHKPLIQPATQLDSFFFDVGVTFTSWDACQRIHPYAEGHENSESGYQIRYLQSECDYFVAQAMHFEHFCDAVRPVSIGMKDGSEFTARFCKRQIYAPEGKGFQIEGAQRSLQLMSSETVLRARVESSILVWSADAGGEENLQQMMRRVGYGDQKVDDFLFARSGINSPTDQMYQERPTLFAAKCLRPTFEHPTLDTRQPWLTANLNSSAISLLPWYPASHADLSFPRSLCCKTQVWECYSRDEPVLQYIRFATTATSFAVGSGRALVPSRIRGC